MPASPREAEPGKWEPFLKFYCSKPAQSTICALLQVSRFMQEAIASHCRGQLPVSVSVRSLQCAQSFSSWLSNPRFTASGHLLSSLNLAIRCSEAGEASEAEDIIAAALQGAGNQATPGPAAAVSSKLLIKAFRSSQPSATILEGLAAAAGNHLTSVQLDFEQVPPEWAGTDMRQLGEALKHLPGLQHLELSGSKQLTDGESGNFMGLDELVPCLSDCTMLTKLEMEEADNQDFLPDQLQELVYQPYSNLDWEETGTWGFYYDGRPELMLALGHLTALTKLTIHQASAHHPEFGNMPRFIEGGTFPPNLAELHIADCNNSKLILQCTKLATLVLEDCRLAAGQLKELGGLTSLREVRLWFPEDQQDPVSSGLIHWAADAAEGWKALPLRSLDIGIELDAIPAQGDATGSASGGQGDKDAASRNRIMLEQLGLQTGLTSLRLYVQCGTTDSVQKLSLLQAPLQHLIQLRELYITKEAPPQLLTNASSADKKNCKGLARAIAALPELNSICLTNVPSPLVVYLHKALASSGSKVKLQASPKLRLKSGVLVDTVPINQEIW